MRVLLSLGHTCSAAPSPLVHREVFDRGHKPTINTQVCPVDEVCRWTCDKRDEVRHILHTTESTGRAIEHFLAQASFDAFPISVPSTLLGHIAPDRFRILCDNRSGTDRVHRDAAVRQLMDETHL